MKDSNFFSTGFLALYLNISTPEKDDNPVERPSEFMARTIFNDFCHVVKSLTLEDLISFFYNLIVEDFFKKSLWGTLVSLFEALKRIVGFTFNLILNPIKTFHEALDKFNKIKSHLISLKDEFFKRDAWGKISLVLKITVGLFAGIIGYSIPDMDITWWGIGSHRNFATHSVIPLVVMRTLTFAVIRLARGFKEKLPKNHHPIWDILLKESVDLAEAAELGIAFGIGCHLFQDLFIDGSQAIRGPWGGTIFKGTYLDDNAFLGVNMVASLNQEEKNLNLLLNTVRSE